MKFSLFLILIIFLNSCSKNENDAENNFNFIEETNESKFEVLDENISIKKETSVAKTESKSPINTEEKIDNIPPMEPTVTTQPNLDSEGHLQMSVRGEIGARVYVESMFEGTIGSSQVLDVKLSNPKEDYYEKFEIILSDEVGNDSSPLKFSTTFNRKSIDGNYTYYIPQNVNTMWTYANNIEGLVLTQYPKGKDEVASVLMKYEIDDNQTNILKLNPIVHAIQNSSIVTDFINLSVQELREQESVLAQYVIGTNKPISSMNLMQYFLSGIDEKGDYYLTERKKEERHVSFTIKASLFQKYLGENYLSLSIVPSKFALKHQSMIDSMLNSQNIKRNTTAIYMKEEKLVAKVLEKEESANFLFVIDDSGSMADYQRAIAQTAKEFASAIKNVGMKFKVAIITTGEESDAFELLESDGIIENDIDLFQESLHVGTSGSPLETAIYNMELALKSKKEGAKDNGILTTLDMPKVNEKLSIIILSDEWSSYKERAEKEFDIENNLFVQRDYRVYVIGLPSEEEQYLSRYREKPVFKHTSDSYGLYGALARETGGLLEDIRNVKHYKNIMNTIIQNVLGDLGYKLEQKNIIESTIYVRINDEEIPYNTPNGWKYNQVSNSILFSGTSIPDEDDNIVVRYGYSLDE